mmetsp:Transcript_17734/g.30121  ORF Transcript_17734/g.30121 Transcript_17734/m.30121 type:complete len:204 (+) Transcript_17734:147-758(+)
MSWLPSLFSLRIFTRTGHALEDVTKVTQFLGVTFGAYGTTTRHGNKHFLFWRLEDISTVVGIQVNHRIAILALSRVHVELATTNNVGLNHTLQLPSLTNIVSGQPMDTSGVVRVFTVATPLPYLRNGKGDCVSILVYDLDWVDIFHVQALRLNWHNSHGSWYVCILFGARHLVDALVVCGFSLFFVTLFRFETAVVASSFAAT